jgi:phosphomannomutase
MQSVRQALPQAAPRELAAKPVLRCVYTDGAKFLFADDEWLLLRASGTEDLLRIYAEANSLKSRAALLAAGQELAHALALPGEV